MANGFGSLFVGTSGLQSAQNALNTTANNLSNVNTAGYVREQVRFSDKHYNRLKDSTVRTNMHQYGLGVSIGDVVHARDIFLDKAFRQETGRAAFYSTSYDAVMEVEDMFQEMNGEEFKQSVIDLYTAFQELEKAPEDSTNQNLIIQKSELFLVRCQSLYSDLQNYQSNLNNQIRDHVNRINEIGNKIYEINLQIQKIEVGGVETAMELRDQRDAMIDELASYGGVSVREDWTGFTYVDFEGQEFITEGRCNNIGLNQAQGTGFYTPYWPHLSNAAANDYTPVFRTDVDISTEYNNDLGTVKALLMARGDGYGRYYDLTTDQAYRQIEDCTVEETQAQIDLLFHSLITRINDLYCPNTTLTAAISDGTTTYPPGTKILDVENCSYGVDGELPPQELFTRIGSQRYTKITANGKDYYVYNEEDPADSATQYIIGSVKINEELKKQVTKLPTYTRNGAVNYKIAQSLSAIWEDPCMSLNPKDAYPCTYTNFYDKVISKLGTDGNTYNSQAQTTQNTATSLDNQRTQVMGVSSDEELTKMIKYQSAYNAASRYITVISEMTELIVTGLK